MLLIVGEDHHVWVSALIYPVLILLHIVGSIHKLQCLVSIQGIGCDLNIAPVLVGEVGVGRDVRIWCRCPSQDIVFELLYEVLDTRLDSAGPRARGTHLLRWIWSGATGYSGERRQVHTVASVLGHLVSFSKVRAWSSACGAAGGCRILMSLRQIAEDLMATVQPTDVPFRIMFIDPWVDDLGAPMFKLDLQM